MDNVVTVVESVLEVVTTAGLVMIVVVLLGEKINRIFLKTKLMSSLEKLLKTCI